MSPVTDIEWETCFVERTHDAAQERYVRQALGVVPPMTVYFFPCPWIVRTIVAFDVSQLGLVHTDLELSRLIGLVVSQDNSCRYCYAASRALLKIIGYSEARVRRLEQDLLTAELSVRVRLALEFARRVSRANPLASAADTADLRQAGYSDDAIKELAYLAAINVYYNRLATLPAVPTDSLERLDSGWMLKLLRPLFARSMKSKTKSPPPLTADLQAGPYGYLVRAFAGLPIASPLWRGMQEAWASPLLPRRAKALIFAVVARGLGCPIAEREATQLLTAEGLQLQEIETILAHLASPALDPVEAAIVPFARETIWYRPAQIQRRARTVSTRLAREQFLELTGVVALANAVSRMSVVLPQQ